MTTTTSRFMRIPLWFAIAGFIWGGGAYAEDFPEDTPVYYTGGNRGHIEGCPRLDNPPNTTFGEMLEKGGQLCSRCPGSELNEQREAEAVANRKPTGIDIPKRQAPLAPEVEYDPNTLVYLDRLWYRGHAADCPNLILKEHKETITLAEADKAGLRVGISGQSGRGNCCFIGYHNEHPWKEVDGDDIFAGDDRHDRRKHYPGCHRYWPDASHSRRPVKEWAAEGYPLSPHCMERGPMVATISDEAWRELGSDKNTYPIEDGFQPEPFAMDTRPSQEQLEALIREALNGGYAIQELPYTDPIASVEMFMNMRFFFPVTQWLTLYQVYRGTGDERLLEMLRVSARHYNKLSRDYLSAAQTKARDPEGMAYMLSMALSSRITLQLARQSPDQVDPQEIAEAEEFLKTIVSVLKPTCEGDTGLDPQMGIPQALADDFRSRASNRATNGIGTLAMTIAALEDLQALKGTTEYQSTIERYRKVVEEFVGHFKNLGHLCDELPGQPMFIYPYGQEPKPRMVDDCKVFGRPEDGGHYTHCLQGLTFIYQATPELGIDDEFMTAVANAVHYNSTTALKEHGNAVAGLIQCPTGYRVHKKKMKGKNFGARDRFYLLNAFRDDVIEGQLNSLDPKEAAERGRGFDERKATLYAQYLKALRTNRDLIHL